MKSHNKPKHSSTFISTTNNTKTDRKPKRKLKKRNRKKSAKSYGYGITRGIENSAIINKRRKYEIKSKSKLQKKYKEDTKHIKSITNECNELQTSRGRKVFRYNGLTVMAIRPRVTATSQIIIGPSLVRNYSLTMF